MSHRKRLPGGEERSQPTVYAGHWGARMRVSRERISRIERSLALGMNHDAIRMVFIDPATKETGRRAGGEWVFHDETEIPAEWSEAPGLTIIMTA